MTGARVCGVAPGQAVSHDAEGVTPGQALSHNADTPHRGEPIAAEFVQFSSVGMVRVRQGGRGGIAAVRPPSPRPSPLTHACVRARTRSGARDATPNKWQSRREATTSAGVRPSSHWACTTSNAGQSEAGSDERARMANPMDTGRCLGAESAGCNPSQMSPRQCPAALMIILALAALSLPAASGSAVGAQSGGGGSSRGDGAGRGHAALMTKHAGCGGVWGGAGTPRIALRGGGQRKSAALRDQRRREVLAQEWKQQGLDKLDSTEQRRKHVVREGTVAAVQREKQQTETFEEYADRQSKPAWKLAELRRRAMEPYPWSKWGKKWREKLGVPDAPKQGNKVTNSHKSSTQ